MPIDFLAHGGNSALEVLGDGVEGLSGCKAA